MELLALFSGCTLKLLDRHRFDPWLFDVFAWLHLLADRLPVAQAEELITPAWLPNLPVSSLKLLVPPMFLRLIRTICPQRLDPHARLPGPNADTPSTPRNAIPYTKIQALVKECIKGVRMPI